nr:unnamed protein product [Spirometra erinaceieuropaei]
MSPEIGEQIDVPFTCSQIVPASVKAKRLTGTASVSVRILDENDCVPEFTQSLYSFSVDENVPEFSKHSARKVGDTVAGHAIGTIRAVDRDLNSRLTYQLQSNPLEAFALDAQTGILTVVRPFDREALFSSTHEGVEIRKPKETAGGTGNESIVVVHLSASVSDGLHSANTRIQVVILDVNDCAPVFERSNYEFYVQENERPSTNQPVGRVLARDADAGFNGRILYRLDAVGHMGDKMAANGSKLARDYNPIRFFKIDRETGTLHILRPLDREQYSHHLFYVLAIDTSNKAHYQVHPLSGESMWPRGQYHGQQVQQKQSNQFTATATVTVIVNDVNDNAPTISFPTPHSTLAVEAGAPAGQHIFTVAASDPDLGENSTIRFTLRQSALTVSGPDSVLSVGSKTATEVADSLPPSAKPGGSSPSVFSIDEHAGIVFLTDKLPNKAAKHLLIIGAHDLGSVQKNTSVAAIINVVQKTTFDPNLLLDLGSQALKSEQAEPSGPLSDRLGTAQSNKYSMNQPMGQQQLQHQQQLQQQQRHQHPNRDRELVQGDQGMSPVYMFTDRVIIFVLSAIFVVLLIVTMVLIFLIRRRRFMEMHPGRTHKHPGKPQVRNNIEAPVLQCTTNSLQLIQTDGGTGTAGKTAVFFRKDVPSDGTSQADSDGRSGLGNDSYPQQALITSDDSYTLLKALGRNQMAAIPAGELAPSVCKAYGHCLPLTSFAPVVQVNNGIPTRGTYLGQPVMPGFAPIFSMPSKTASTGGYVSIPKQGPTGGVVQSEAGRRTVSPDHLIFGTNFTSPKRLKPSGQQSPFNDLPNYLSGVEEGRRSEYQKLIQPKKNLGKGGPISVYTLNPQSSHFVQRRIIITPYLSDQLYPEMPYNERL